MVDVKKLEVLPCPICGNKSYEWGTLTAQGLTFSSERESGFRRELKMGYRAKARRCVECLNIQIFK